MEQIINVMVRNKVAVADQTVYICGNGDNEKDSEEKNGYALLFDFDEEWNKYEHKTARFKYNGKYIDVLFSGNKCPVPIISNTYGIDVGVYAGDLCTTTPAYIPAKKSILCGNPAPADPTPDVYHQIMALLNDLNEVSEEEVEQAVQAYLADNSFVSGGNAKNCYETERVDYGVAQETLKTDYVLGLYNKLAEDYPGCVSVEAISTDDGSFTNYAYTFSLGEYNTRGVRGELDTYIKKPKYLVLSGIHGREKTAVMATYHFFRDLAEGKNVPVNFREGAIFKIMPVGNTFGFNQKGISGASEPDYGRANANGVDINRNFDYNWSSDATENRNPGEYAGSEQETQVIAKWLEANSDAALFIDHHNSSSDNYNEVAMVVGLNTDNIKKAKQTALRGLDRIIPSWKSEIDNGKKVYSYSSFVDCSGLCIYYANEVVGIPSLALETCTRQDDPNTSLTPVSIAIGAEAVGNILLEFYEQSDDTNFAEEGKFAVSDGKGGIKWLSAFKEDEVGY